VGGSADASVTAAYYAGGSLAGADVAWRVAATPGSFTPPNRDDFTFGEWTPWWELTFEDGEPPGGDLPGRTDCRRQAPPADRLRLVDAAARHDRPGRGHGHGRQPPGLDRGRDAARPSVGVYVGLKSDRLFVQRGEVLRVQAIVTDLDGRRGGRTARPAARERLEWTREDGEWKEAPVDGQDCALQSAAEAASAGSNRGRRALPRDRAP
jgi:hypothetical protein